MNLLADEGVERQIVERLRADGHSVWYIAEMSPGISDEVILSQANEDRALLITLDKDFGELVFRQQLVYEGVLLLRLAGVSNDTKAAIVSDFLQKRGPEMAVAFSVITPGNIRIRKRRR
jgi:predicted nuclease of predicted toxin-antitoxin system